MFIWRPSVSPWNSFASSILRCTLNPSNAKIHEAMSEVRVSVEWMFGTITNYYKFVDFKKQLKTGMSPVGKIYLVCGILQNAHTCLYGNLVSDYFNLEPPSLQDYFW